jgi:HK97 family phage portal protein
MVLLLTDHAPRGYGPGVAVKPGVVARRLRSSGLTAGASRQTSYPSSRAAWAFLTGETFDTRLGVPASRDEALSLPAFGRGVELLASAVSGVELVGQTWDADSGVWTRIADQPNVLSDPEGVDGSTAWHWRYACVKDLVEAGNHVCLLSTAIDPTWVDWRTNRAAFLLPLPVEHVALIVDPSRPFWWQYAYRGMILDRSEVLHISAGNRSGEVLGQGIVSQYTQTLGQQLTAEQWAARYLAGGGVPPAIIQAPLVLAPDQANTFKADWRRMMSTGEALLLPSNVTVTPLQSDAQRQQLVEARTWNAQLSAMILGIPSHMLGLPGPNMTYQTVETSDIGWVKDTVDRWAQPIEATISKQLLPNGTRAKFNWAGRLRTDQTTQAAVVTTLVGAGIWTVDEGRQAIGYEPMADAIDEGSTPVDVPDLGAKEAL